MFIRLLISPTTAAVRRGLTMSISGLVTLGTISSGSALISMSRLIFRQTSLTNVLQPDLHFSNAIIELFYQAHSIVFVSVGGRVVKKVA